MQVFSKSGHDWTNKVPRLARSLARLAVHSACLDGEIVFQQEDGRPVFHALRPAFDSGQTLYWFWPIAAGHDGLRPAISGPSGRAAFALNSSYGSRFSRKPERQKVNHLWSRSILKRLKVKVLAH